MAGRNDWIRVPRSVIDCGFWDDDWLVRLWLWCRIKANFAGGEWRGQKIQRGQFVTGRHSAAEELRVSPSKFYRGIHSLEKFGALKVDANSNWTRITVCDYETYDSEQSANRTDSGQLANTRKECTSNTHTHTPIGDREIPAFPEPATPMHGVLKTWQDPPDETNQAVIAAVDLWQAHSVQSTGRPVDGIRMHAMLMESRRKQWSPEKLMRCVQFSISKNAKSWLDADLDFERLEANKAQTKATDASKPPRENRRKSLQANKDEANPFL